MYSVIWSSLIEIDSEARPYYYISEEGIKIKKINLFIGKNNSGKSLLLRKLFISNEDELLFRDIENNKKNKKSLEIINDIINEGNKPSNISSEIENILDFADIYYTGVASVNQLNSVADSINDLGFKFKIKDMHHRRPIIPGVVRYEIPNKIYIPIIRGLRSFSQDRDFYKERTVEDYFAQSSEQEESICDSIHTGYNLYFDYKRGILGETEDRKKIDEYEGLLSKYFFSGEKIKIIPSHDKDSVSVKVGKEKQLPIYELGDGLQQVIIITYKAYLTKKDSLFFIEEPENNMHPGLLRQLINFLIEETSHQYFMTTHSNHLLDMIEYRGDDVTIHRVSKKITDDTTEFHVKQLGKDRSILTELGVHPSSVYLANCTIWIEGITDRLYIRAYMEKYIQELKKTEEAQASKLSKYLDSYHYAFVEYNGSNMVHWNFGDEDISETENNGLSALTTTAEAFLVADFDTTGKGGRKEVLEAELKDRYILTTGKEIENTLPLEVIKSTAIAKIKKITATQKNKTQFLDGVKPTPDEKKEKITELCEKINDFNTADYQKDKFKGVGFYLDQALGLPSNGESIGYFSSNETGQLSSGYKVEFCREAVEYMKESDVTLTEEIENLCGNIFNHIEKNNFSI